MKAIHILSWRLKRGKKLMITLKQSHIHTTDIPCLRMVVQLSHSTRKELNHEKPFYCFRPGLFVFDGLYRSLDYGILVYLLTGKDKTPCMS
jgi:hypothetical protein